MVISYNVNDESIMYGLNNSDHLMFSPGVYIATNTTLVNHPHYVILCLKAIFKNEELYSNKHLMKIHSFS